jgi:hypothetical protein
MKESDRLHLRIDSELKTAIAVYARKRGTTVSAIVINYFEHLLKVEQLAEAGQVPEVEQI